jgi:hypothetical protein
LVTQDTVRPSKKEKNPADKNKSEQTNGPNPLALVRVVARAVARVVARAVARVEQGQGRWGWW